MTRKDYEAFATEIRMSLDDEHIKLVMANRIANVFQRDNPRFSREQFLRACKVKD